MITKLEEIIQTVQGQPRKKLAVAYAQDSHTLEAVGAAVDMGIVEAILVGDRDEESSKRSSSATATRSSGFAWRTRSTRKSFR